MDNKCVMCDKAIPEGRQVCPRCEFKIMQKCKTCMYEKTDICLKCPYWRCTKYERQSMDQRRS